MSESDPNIDMWIGMILIVAVALGIVWLFGQFIGVEDILHIIFNSSPEGYARIQHQSILIGIRILSLIIIVSIFTLLIWGIYSLYQRKEDKNVLKHNFLRKLEEITVISANLINEPEPQSINDFSKKLSDIIRFNMAENHKTSIDAFKYKLQQAKILYNQKLENVKKEKEQVKEIYHKKVKEVYWIFRDQSHTDSIPEQCIEYSKDIISEAIDVYDYYIKDEQRKWAIQKRQQRELQEAQEFVWKNKGLPSNYHSLNSEDQCYYGKALGQLNDGSLKPIMQQLITFKRREQRQALINDEEYENLGQTIEAGKIREDSLLKNLFYYVKELTPQEASFLIKFHGYKKGKATDLHGKGFNPVIFRKVGRESDKHFCMKHMFARLHHSAEIEKTDYWGNEIDILFTKGKSKIPVEIETGTNKINYVIEKISNLRRHYKKVLVITNRKHLPKYKVHKDNNQVFVKTPKNGKRELLQWLS